MILRYPLFRLRHPSRWVFLGLCLTASMLQAEPETGPANQARSGPSRYFSHDHGTRSWIFSAGDALAMPDMFPVNNPTDVKQLIPYFDNLFNIKRIIWRGSQDDRIMSNFHRFDDFFFLRGIFDCIESYYSQNLSEVAARAAKARGIEFWGCDTLTEIHNMPWVDAGKGFGSSFGTVGFMYNHPEWMPVDRIGLRRQGGMFSDAIPDARRAFVDTYDRYLTTHPFYDGIWLYDYIENFEEQFEDEFGFEEPIVAEYKHRYGVDIRTQPFDHQKWYDLKGEYFTQLIRELHTVFKKHGVKMAIALDPTHMDRPIPWTCGGAVLRPTGRFAVEWRKWIQEGLVDELTIYTIGIGGGDDYYWKAYQEVAQATKDTPIKVSILYRRTLSPRWNGALDAGLDHLIQEDPFRHTGYPEKRPLGDIASSDSNAKLNVLHQLQWGAANYDADLSKDPATWHTPEVRGTAAADDGWILKNVAPLLSDSNVLVRRQAVNTLACVKDPVVIPLLEGSLIHDESAVQCFAARALGGINGPNTVAAFRTALANNHNFGLADESVRALAKFPVQRQADIIAALKDSDPYVREIIAHSYSRRRTPLSPSEQEALLSLLKDPDENVRYSAVYSLADCGPAVKDALLDVVRNDNVYVAQRAAIGLANIFSAQSQVAAQKEIVGALQPIFARFGQGQSFREHDWAWRPIGNSLYRLGPIGQNVLRDFLLNGKDKLLSDRAWQCLYARVDGWGWTPILEEDAVRNYRFAQFRPGSQVPPVFEAAPAQDPNQTPNSYLLQKFTNWPRNAKGTVGDVASPAGAWSPLGDAPPAPFLQSLHAYDGGKAIELTSPRHFGQSNGIEAKRARPLPAGSVYLLSCRVHIPYIATNVQVGMRDEKSGGIAGFVLSGDGTISSTSGYTVAHAVQAEDWNRIGVVYNLARHTMTVETGPTLDHVLLKDLPIAQNAVLSGFAAIPSGLGEGMAYLSDVEITPAQNAAP